MTELEKLQTQLRACRHCEGMLEPRPVVHGNPGAPILQVSQAPGKKVHETGIPFNDASGRRLRQDWYQISDAQFYDPDLFYITSMGHCYPGKGKTGDKKPPRCCFDLWTRREIELKPGTRMMLVIGREAASRLFPKREFTELVFQDQEYDGIPCYVLPHPSPLNVRWFRMHPEFETQRMPVIREKLHQVLREAGQTGSGSPGADPGTTMTDRKEAEAVSTGSV
ncbi:uracil-DNA glycosylase family protein [Faecalibaculum rodentium]|jgi:uracil-DNA glycosylase family 4|uniref:uracil-DNA glycosylase family protein n=1 Tax=Faecalibaculum rodentium TaxID=1702221 RepID=UPI00249312FF|nr:uracil-DNA glycosylase family protein [Faecalibaculum rodentium]